MLARGTMSWAMGALAADIAIEDGLAIRTAEECGGGGPTSSAVTVVGEGEDIGGKKEAGKMKGIGGRVIPCNLVIRGAVERGVVDADDTTGMGIEMGAGTIVEYAIIGRPRANRRRIKGRFGG